MLAASRWILVKILSNMGWTMHRAYVCFGIYLDSCMLQIRSATGRRKCEVTNSLGMVGTITCIERSRIISEARLCSLHREILRPPAVLEPRLGPPCRSSHANVKPEYKLHDDLQKPNMYAWLSLSYITCVDIERKDLSSVFTFLRRSSFPSQPRHLPFGFRGETTDQPVHRSLAAARPHYRLLFAHKREIRCAIHHYHNPVKEVLHLLQFLG